VEGVSLKQDESLKALKFTAWCGFGVPPEIKMGPVNELFIESNNLRIAGELLL